MAGPNYVLELPYQPAEAMNKLQAVRMVVSAPDTIEVCDVQGEWVLGIVQETVSAEDVTNGRIVNVRIMGVAMCIAEGAITAGAPVTASTVTDGSLEAAAAADVVAGRALSGAASGDYFNVLLSAFGPIL